MNIGRTIFSQVIDHLPIKEFRKCVGRYQGDRYVKRFSCWDQFLSMAFAQLTYRDGLRDIESCLQSVGGKLYHMGFRSEIKRSTLADANELRDWRIYADFAQALITTARPLYAAEPLGVELTNTVYALDATTIELCLSLCPWATFRRRSGAMKIETQLDLRGSIPTVVHVVPGSVNEIELLDHVIPEPGAIYLMDRGFIDYTRFLRLTTAGSFFVVRAKRDLRCVRVYSHPVDRTTGLRSDHTIRLTGPRTRFAYPGHLRRVRFIDPVEHTTLIFLTNQFSFPALTIAALYKLRWQVELFFKWIKQHLCIRAFYGTSLNAVTTQVWIALSVYVLVAIVKKRLGVALPLYTILQILSVTLFEKVSLAHLLTTFRLGDQPSAFINQLSLFEL